MEPVTGHCTNWRQSVCGRCVCEGGGYTSLCVGTYKGGGVVGLWVCVSVYVIA